MKTELKAEKLETRGSDSLDGIMRQAMGKYPSISLSKAGEDPIQWIQLLQALDQQGPNLLSKGPKVDIALEGKERPWEDSNCTNSTASISTVLKESVLSKKCNGVPIKGMQSTSEQMKTLKIPEAVVALAQAAAKVNGEPEKFLPGWPLLSPPKVQMQKCDKCSWEFCSSINYRRHIRVHRRLLNIDKDSSKNRHYLGVFWDKLSLDEAREIVSFKNVTLEELAGPNIINMLEAFTQKPGFSSLPQVYLTAGTGLLDVVQARPSRFPITSQELFSILDDASENTFLCAGTSVSVQKFVFDGEAVKIGLETKNLIACTSFLVEQNLVKAWLTDKDEEALRCQKLLVAEEEAEQKRQAELLERKRLKKLRQKELKAKDQSKWDKANSKMSSPDVFQGSVVPMEATSESNSSIMEASSDSFKPHWEPAQSMDVDLETCEAQHLGSHGLEMDTASGDAEFSNSHNEDPQDNMHQEDSNQQNAQDEVQQHDQMPKTVSQKSTSLKLQRNASTGFHPSHVPPSKSVIQKHNNYRNQMATISLTSNGHKVWARKSKPECQQEGLDARTGLEPRDPLDQSDGYRVLIGSICIKLADRTGQCQDDILATVLEQSPADHQKFRKNNFLEKRAKNDIQNGANQSTMKLWRRVGQQDGGVATADIRDKIKEAKCKKASGDAAPRILSDKRFPFPIDCATGDDCSRRCKDSRAPAGGDAIGVGLFSSKATEAFLNQRWNEAIATDHVTLVLLSEVEPPDLPNLLGGNLAAPPLHDVCQSSTTGNAENPLSTAAPATPVEPNEAKYRPRIEKVSRLKYIPKQRSNA